MTRKRLDGKGHRAACGQRQACGVQIDIDFDAGMLQQPLRGLLVNDDGQQAVLQRIDAKNIGDLSADDGANAEIQERPGSMLARGSAAEIPAGDQDLRAARLGPIQNEIRVRAAVAAVTPIGKQLLAQSFLGGRGEEARGNDLVGVDIAGRDDHGFGANALHGLHYISSRGSVILPRTALAAAVSGLTSSVRAPTPWRPSKLRLLVLIEYWPAGTVSPFIPRHIEQPDSRQSAPADLNISARPEASALSLICCEPGTMRRCTPGATLRPLSMLAAACRSSSRPLVQLPMNTTFTGLPSMPSPL